MTRASPQNEHSIRSYSWSVASSYTSFNCSRFGVTDKCVPAERRALCGTFWGCHCSPRTATHRTADRSVGAADVPIWTFYAGFLCTTSTNWMHGSCSVPVAGANWYISSFLLSTAHFCCPAKFLWACVQLLASVPISGVRCKLWCRLGYC